MPNENQTTIGDFLALIPWEDPRPWWRKLFCWGQCSHRAFEDAWGCGGQCVRCGKVAGYVTRAELRAYADREIEKHAR